jgi:hypothetical protein
MEVEQHWIDYDEKYAEANLHVPVNQDQSNNHNKVGEATTSKRPKEDSRKKGQKMDKQKLWMTGKQS